MISRRCCCACVAVLFASLCAWPMGPMETPLRAQGPDIGTEAQRESGKILYIKYCVAVPRREGGR